MPDNLPARLQPQAPQLTANRKLTELTVDEMSRVAVAFEKSGAFKNNSRAMAAAEIFVIILAGQEMGLGPSQSVMGIRMIEGKPELSANTQAALLKATGKYDYRAVWDMESDDPWCEVTIFSVADGSTIGTSKFSKSDAVAAGIWKNVWLKYPRNMLFARAISNAIAWFAPDATMVRTYHEGESGGDTAAPPPEVEQVPVQQPQSTPEPDREPAVVAAGVQDGYDAPEDVHEDDVAIVDDPGPQEPGYESNPIPFDPITEPDPPVVQPPPTVAVEDNVRTASPGQISLLHVLARNANLSEPDYRDVLLAATGERHADKVPFNRVDDAIKALKALDQKGAA